MQGKINVNCYAKSVQYTTGLCWFILVTFIFFLYVLFCFPIEQVIKAEQKQVSRSLSGTIAEVTNEENSAIRVEIPDIVSVSSCADLTLPPGAGLCIDTTHGPIFW